MYMYIYIYTYISYRIYLPCKKALKSSFHKSFPTASDERHSKALAASGAISLSEVIEKLDSPWPVWGVLFNDST